jgi:hypothetical protein
VFTVGLVVGKSSASLAQSKCGGTGAESGSVGGGEIARL